MQVRVRGVVYPTVRACAEALGVSPATVYCAVSRRDTETLGYGRGRIKRNKGGGLPPKPVVVAGRRFKSIADLARFIDREPRYVRASLRKGEKAQMNIVQAVMAAIEAEERMARQARQTEAEDSV